MLGVLVLWGIKLVLRVLSNRLSPPSIPPPLEGGEPNPSPSGGSWRGEKTSAWSYFQIGLPNAIALWMLLQRAIFSGNYAFR